MGCSAAVPRQAKAVADGSCTEPEQASGTVELSLGVASPAAAEEKGRSDTGWRYTMRRLKARVSLVVRGTAFEDEDDGNLLTHSVGMRIESWLRGLPTSQGDLDYVTDCLADENDEVSIVPSSSSNVQPLTYT
ncbi:hypothetical protein DIPPA_25907 [Diplonema papillatum]|nr:hypothetical protein DIPPA_25907 [Diplonema papillatum]